MPGYVIHMAVASKILENKNITDEDFIHRFLLGNIIPDAMDRSAKKESHFWDNETYKNLNRIPNLDNFLVKYKDMFNNPYVLGYYTHLLLDNLFVKEYWQEHFELLDDSEREENSYDKVGLIKLKAKNEIYPREEFFSDKLYYGDYDRINPYIFEEYPFCKLDKVEALSNLSRDFPIEEIECEAVEETLKNMLHKVNFLYQTRDNLVKEELKIFDLEHIYTLMNKVVSNVCVII